MPEEKPKRRRAKITATAATENAPAIILIKPQLPENIGMVARSMLNCGLGDLRLVSPRDGWPNDRAGPAASGAEAVLDNVKVFDSTAAALADLDRVYATTARPRDMIKAVVNPNQAAGEMRELVTDDRRMGVIFGREAWGLDNDDISLADTIIEIPLNPAFPSLNLAQAVLLVSYEWYRSGDDTPATVSRMRKNTRPANKEELVGFFEHLEMELDACNFLKPPEKRPTMVQNLRAIFQRAELTEQEIRSLRGVISGLVYMDPEKSEKKKRKKKKT